MEASIVLVDALQVGLGFEQDVRGKLGLTDAQLISVPGQSM